MPNRYRPGTVAITSRMPSELRARINQLAAARKTSVNRFIRDRLVEQTEMDVAAMRQRVLNPLRGSPRRRPRDPGALLALAWNTRQQVLRGGRFQQTGPRSWRLL